MNPLLFVLQALVLCGFALASLRMGRAVLGAFAVSAGIMANLLVSKQIVLWGWTVTCGDLPAVGSMLGMSLLRVYFGKDEAKQVLWGGFLALILMAVLSAVHLAYVPAFGDSTQAAYLKILGPAPRLLVASLIAFAGSQWVDWTLLNRLSMHSIAVKIGCAGIVSQFVDTLLFVGIGLFGEVVEFWHVVFFGYIVKLFCLFVLSPCVLLARKTI